MFVYIGTLNYLHASNEAITVTFPAGFEVKDPVSAHWQWSKDPEFNGNKTSISHSGSIYSLTKTFEGSRLIQFSFGPYLKFEGTVSADSKTLSLTISGPTAADSNPQKSKFDLTAQHINFANVRPAIVYTGYLEWAGYRQREMMTIVTPYGVTKGAFFGLYYRWAQDPTQLETVCDTEGFSGEFREVEPSSDCITATHQRTVTKKDDGPSVTFKYAFTFDNSLKKGSLRVEKSNNGSSEPSSEDSKFEVAYEA